MNQSVVGSAPDPIQIQRRRRDGVNDAAAARLFGRVLFVFSNACRQLVFFARQVWADLFPVIAPVARFPERVAGEKQQMWIFRREDYRFSPQRAEIFRLNRHRKNVLRLPSPAIEPRQLSADDDVWIERVRNDIAVFFSCDRLPIPERNLARIAATFDSDRATFLL